MARPVFAVGAVALLLAVGSGWIVWHRAESQDIPTIALSESAVAQKDEQAGLCPWREPEADRKRFFPTSTGYRDETLALSSRRLEMERRLGRPLTGEDNALRIHRILAGQTPIGAIVTRRVRGESGVIELVLAVVREGKVAGARLQRLREPDVVANSLQSPAWLGAFRGKTAGSAWKLGRDIPDIPAAAQTSAEAVVDGARSLLIELELGSGSTVLGEPHH